MKFLYAITVLAVFSSSTAAFATSSSSKRVSFVSAVTPTNTRALEQRGGTIDKPATCMSMTSTSTESDLYTSDISEYITKENFLILSDRGQKALSSLISSDTTDKAQTHVYSDWPSAGEQDEGKIALAEQLADLDESYPGGLPKYLEKAKILLKESADGVNPFSEFTASVPTGESLMFNSEKESGMTFSEAEQIGLNGIGEIAFVLVAGGLGERLGFSGIKLSLETDLLTNRTYLDCYVKYIQAMQSRTPGVKIPLVIMTSGDTDQLTRELLKENNNYGLEEDQITIVCQDKVAALRDSGAGLSMKSKWEVDEKPHGHGDVHHLLFREGLPKKWLSQGKKYVAFLQDTNALVINSILPTLGVSIQQGFHMNSICIPRLAGEAAGAIARLEHNTDPEKSLVINVEYNQLDPLLSTQGDCKGDVSDPATGYSPYPGNANNLIFELESYARTLDGEDQGVVVEFVNPKYKDSTRTEFKKATRLECMMQDFPKLLQKEMGSSANIGFTMFERWFSFSPAKNSLESGQDAVKGGSSAPGTLSSAESDKYLQNQRKMKFAGVEVPEESFIEVSGIPITAGPYILLEPNFSITQQDLLEKIEGGKISQSSFVVIDGEKIKLKNIDVDGALVIKISDGVELEVDGLVVKNKGWQIIPNKEDETYEETVAIRGYTLDKSETMEIEIQEPGKYSVGEDGVVKKLE